MCVCVCVCVCVCARVSVSNLATVLCCSHVVLRAFVNWQQREEEEQEGKAHMTEALT